MSEKELKQLLAVVKKELQTILGDNLVKIILYGSYANNTFNEESDVDIMVLTDLTEEDIKQIDEKISELVLELSLEYNVFVSIFIKPAETFNKFSDVIPFYNNVLDHGIILYE